MRNKDENLKANSKVGIKKFKPRTYLMSNRDRTLKDVLEKATKLVDDNFKTATEFNCDAIQPHAPA